MKKRLKSGVVPYTAIPLTFLNKGETFLDAILLDSSKLHPRKVDKPMVLYGAGKSWQNGQRIF